MAGSEPLIPKHGGYRRLKSFQLAQTSKGLHGQSRTNTDRHGQTGRNPSMRVGESPCSSVPGFAHLAANAALSLLSLCCRLLDRQLAAQAKAFENEGGFTEYLYRVRSQKRRQS